MKKWFSVRKWILPVGLGILTLLPIVGVDIAHGAVASFGDSDALKGLAEIAAVGINIFTFLALVIINFFSDLIGTDFIIGDQAMNAIKPMWIIVRNLVNVMFVVMLVFLAFSNLFASIAGEGGGSWTIKEKLPKIIISLVAINFSLLGFRLIIDAVNVGTIAILGIADHKLEGDNQVSMGGFVSERTWIKLTDEEVKNGDGPELKETSNFKGKEDVKEMRSCTTQHERFMNNPDSKLINDEIIVIKADTSDNSTGNSTYACRTFAAQINNTFCPQWKDHVKKGEIDKNASQADKDEKNAERMTAIEGDVNCMFMMNTNKLSSETILQARNAPGQNLFMAFGTVFMHLEKLPSLAAHLGSLDGVLINTLFSALMSIMFLVALVAVFIALLGRVVVLWVALVFSPVIVVAKVMEFDSGAGDISTQIVTAIIMPLKIAAAFAVGFVMLSAMVTISPGMTGGESTFWFGAALSQMGQDEYAFLWQIATVFLFWKAAKWSVEGNIAESITNGIFEGAQRLGTVAARAATIDRPLFGASTGGGKFSLSTLAKMPQAMETAHRSEMMTQLGAMRSAFGMDKTGEGAKATELAKKINTWNGSNSNRTGVQIADQMKDWGSSWKELSHKDVLDTLAQQKNLKAFFTPEKIAKIAGNAALTKQAFIEWNKSVGGTGDMRKIFEGIELGTEKPKTGGEGKNAVVTGTGIGAAGGTMYTAAALAGGENKLAGVAISDAQFDKFATASNKTSAADRAALAKTMADQGAEFKNLSTDKGVGEEGKSKGFFFTDRRGNYIDIGDKISGGNKSEVENIITNNVQASYGAMENQADKDAVLAKLNSALATNKENTFKIEPDANGNLKVINQETNQEEPTK